MSKVYSSAVILSIFVLLQSAVGGLLHLPSVAPGNVFIQRYPSGHFFFSEYRLGVCGIPKNMSLMMRYMLIDLFFISRNETYALDEDGFPDEVEVNKNAAWNQSVEPSTGPAWKNESPVLVLRRKEAEQAEEEGGKKVINTVIIRDPLDRFISAYSYLCIRLKTTRCPDSVLEMAKAVFKLLRGGSYGHNLRPDIVERVQFHFAPQTWFCHSGDEEAKEKVKFLRHSRNQTANVEMVDELFKEAGVDETVREKTLRRMRKQQTTHSSNRWERHRILREIRRNPQTLQWIVRIYRLDYQLLGYPIPKSVNDI